MVSTRSKTGATPARSPIKTISKKRHSKAPPSPRKSVSSAFPDVSLRNDAGTIVSTHSLLSDAAPGLILFTYPRANTGGCTTQAKGLSALREAALATGYSIVGCSYDSVKSQASWKVKSSISLMLLSDTPSSGLLRKLSVHKAPRGVKRSVFVITRKGDSLDIVLAKRAVSPKECIALMEQYIKDNPLKVPSAKSDPDHIMTDDKPQQQQTSAAVEAAAPEETHGTEKPQDKQPGDQPMDTDQLPEVNQTANHANDLEPASKEPKSTSKDPELASKEPEPASKETEPASKKSKPASKDPEPASKKSEPASKDPEPASKTSEPASKDPEPTSKKSEPASKDPKPAPKDPEHASRKSEPTSKGPESAAPAAPPAEQTNDKPADAPKPHPDETASKSTDTKETTQTTSDDKPVEQDSFSTKDQKPATDAKLEAKAGEKATAASTEKPVVMDIEKPQEEGKA